jgi:hypothetical protein
VGTAPPPGALAPARLRLARPGSASALATALALLGLLLAAALIPLSVLARQDVASNAGQAVSYLAVGATGLVVARRQPRNPIGWLLLAVPVGVLLNKGSQSYVWLAYRSGQRLPFGSAALLLSFAWVVLIVALPLVILLFPDGRLPSPGWRWPLRAYLVVVASLVACGYVATVSVIAAHDVRVDSGGGLAAVDYPSGRTAWLSTVLVLMIPLLVAFWLVFAGRLVLTWRRAATGPGEASQERRHQLKWIMSGSLAALSAGAIDSIVSALDPHAPAVVQAISSLLNDAGLATFAVCVGVAILKYRLYDIDRIISRTLAYAIVTGLLVGVYAGLVLLATQVLRFSSPVAVAAATLAAAALFNPVRRRVQQAVDRRFNRARYDADQTIAAFAARLQDATDLHGVPDDLAVTVQQALEPAHVSVWISHPDSS